jgi:aspartyl-tRNA(Asn)/glutamyl-tRNA(Gln) amidotransferase subunit A
VADVLELSALELGRAIERREVSPVEVVQAVQRRLNATEPALNAFVLRLDEQALAEARTAEQEIAAGRYRGPLHGIPLAVKDNIAVAGTVTAAGAKFLADNVTPDDAEAVRRLRAAGAIVIGKTNLHELALGGTTDNPHYGATHNPWKLGYIPGGSSGGSAAAVAACQVPIALGTDSAGSVRMPASVCGIVGLKPTHGRVSARGLVASLTVTTDHIGPMTRTVADAALLLEVMAPYDARDPFSRDKPVPAYREALRDDLRGVRVGVPTNFFFDVVDREVEAGVRVAIAELERLGATLVEVSIPDCEELMEVRVGFGGEGLAFVTPYLRAHPEQFSKELRQRLYVQQFVLARDYARTNRARRLLQERFATVFQSVDLLAAPATAVPAWPIPDHTIVAHDYRRGEDVPQATNAILRRLTAPSNSTGLPAISLPCGFTAAGLPIGLQLIGRAFDEAGVLAAAHAYEQATPWHTRRPELATAAGGAA